MMRNDIAFTDSVKALQSRRGSREAYAENDFLAELSDDLVAFVQAQRSVFLATANSAGQPYIQHRGGPPGFLHVRNAKTIAFADFAGNRQYITEGNLSENQRAHLFLIDYARRRRVKIWGRAETSEDAKLVAALMPANYRARPERAIVFHINAVDINCPQHIPQRFDAEDVAAALAERDEKIKALENEIAVLHHKLSIRDICGDDI